MKQYDIVFVGHFATGTIFPFEGEPFVEPGSPVLFASMAASCLGKKIATVTKISEHERHLLEPLRAAGIDLFAEPGRIAEYRVVFPTADVDRRQPFLVRGGDDLTIEDMPDVEPCLVHLCCIAPRESQLELMRALKKRGFRLSVDMQGFVLQADERTGSVYPQDVPEKKEILGMVDFVKLDAMEARTLTGVEALEEQAAILQEWGNGETIITSSEGALAHGKGQSVFAPFTNRSTVGRMGRGDTLIGSYLARRLDYPLEDSIRFAAALTSIKMEHPGPFRGSLEDVVARMESTGPGCTSLGRPRSGSSETSPSPPG